jgi:SAM-dependent methyltransferase
MPNFIRALRRALAALLAPSPRTIAAQLRRPSGSLGQKVGEKMSRSNAPLYDFALQNLRLAAGERVLEIGFGNGKHFPRLLAQAPELHVSGLDFSAEMLRQARQNNPDNPQLHLVAGSSEQMPFPDAAFDAVLCVNVIYFWEKPAAHLREVRRVLRPGGRFLAAVRSPETMARLPFVQHGFRLYDEASWSALLLQNGFHNIEAARQMEPPVQTEGGAYALESLCITGCVKERVNN